MALVKLSRAQRASVGAVQAQPARFLVILAIPRAVRGQPASRRSSPMTGRFSCQYKGELLFPPFCRISGVEIRRIPRPNRLSRSGQPGRNQRQWLDDLAADPLFLQYGQQRPADAGAVETCLPTYARGGLRQISARRRMIPIALSAISTGSEPTTRAAMSWRGSSMASCCRSPSVSF